MAGVVDGCARREHNRLRIAVSESDAGRPIFQVGLPGVGLDAPMLERISVVDASTDNEVCLVVCSGVTERMWTWRYGTAIRGCGMSRCETLSGGRYRVGIAASGGLGVTEFFVPDHASGR